MSETPDRTESLFTSALALSSKERSAFLERECSTDAALRQRLEGLLRAHERAGHLLDRPAHVSPEGVAASAAAERAGTIVAGRYKLLEEIGVGGMGTVWVAEQIQPVRRKVALKLIKPGMDSRSVLARFEAERQALAIMDHPNIAKVLDGGLTESGRPFFAMEYVKGIPITEYCDANRLSVADRLNLFVQVCSAVQHAHQKGVIHRDLKPSNILVAPYDDLSVPKVIDFGLAKAMHQSLTDHTLHTAHEAVLGTPLYMSPEQAQLNNLDVDTRSDVYSLGVLLYELLTGTTPLERKRLKEAAWDEVWRIIREEEPPRPSARLTSTAELPSLAAIRQTEPIVLTKQLRGELDWIVMRALEKDRTRRYETANGLARDVQRYLADEVVEARPPSTRYRLRKFARRHRGKAIVLSLISLAAMLVLSVTTWSIVLARRAQERAYEQHALAEYARDQAGRLAAAERQAKLQAEVQREEAEQQRARALSTERLALDRARAVEVEKQKLDEERQRAKAVSDFVASKPKAQEADAANFARALTAIGSNLVVQRKYAEAEVILRECLQSFEKLIEKKQLAEWELGSVKSMLGEALLGQKKVVEAAPLLEESYRILQQQEQAIPQELRYERLTEALRRLIDLAAASNRPQDGQKWQAELDKYRAKAPLPRIVK